MVYAEAAKQLFKIVPRLVNSEFKKLAQIIEPE